MSLIPWSQRDSLLPTSMLRQFQDEFADMFKSSPMAAFASRSFPAIDIRDNDKLIHVSAELPGVEKKNVTIEVDGNTLTIRGEKKEDTTHQKDNWWRRESSYGSFMRRVALPSEVDPSHSEAKMTNGVLEIQLRKTAAAKTKAIEIH